MTQEVEIKPPQAFELTPGERISPLWQRLHAHLEARLIALRTKNDNPLQTEQQTAALRGEISCLKHLISLNEESPIVDD